MRVERLPFTVYDIVGYLVPGVLLLWFFLAILSHISVLDSLLSFVIFAPSDYGKALGAIIFFIVAYTLGHLIGFLSSITVERLAIAVYGYPSTYVCRDYCEKHKLCEWSVERNSDEFDKQFPFYRLIISIILLPVTIGIYVVNATNLINMITKSLPISIVEIMASNFEKRTESVGGSKKRINFENGRNWFQFICFYCFNNHQNVAHRLYNYLTIYGFLRNICFLFIIVTWILLGHSIDIIEIGNHVYRTHIDWSLLCLAGAGMLVSVMTFFAFMKFFRRYTEEAIIAFATIVHSQPNYDVD